MAARKKVTMSGAVQSLTTAKPGGAPPPSAAEPAAKANDRRGQTIRLSPEAWRQLKLLALDDRKPAHDLLLDAIGDYFVKRGLPPLT